MNVTYLQIEPTTKCNFTCGFCVGRHMKQQHMDLEAFKNAVGAVSNLKHISLQGEGEPLLHPQFNEMIQYVKSVHPEAVISFISNGSFFSKRNIELILSSEINRIMVSIESADEDTFREIRGGKLSKVKRGIETLLAERNLRNLSKPIIGFAVTVMKKTKDDYKDILKLYLELGLDGGFTCQFLQEMKIYTKYYDEAMMKQILSDQDAENFGKAISNDPLIEDILANSVKENNFYEDLYSSTTDGCPWLANGLYVTTDGIATGCCYMKESDKYGFGIVNSESIKRILATRNKLQNKLLNAHIPKVCSGCPIATKIKEQHENIVTKFE